MPKTDQMKCCEVWRQLSEEFATTARLYSEAVTLLTSNAPNLQPHEYNRLRHAVEEAQRRSEGAGIAYEEHLDAHHRTDTTALPAGGSRHQPVRCSSQE